MASRVVYTAITNRHARLSPHPSVPDTDFICYSDVPLDRDDWEIRPIEAPPQLSPRMQAKFHKLFPPAGYMWNVWVEGAYTIRTDAFACSLVDEFIAHSSSGFGLHKHDGRDCLFDEAAESMARDVDKRKDQRLIIEAQTRHYEAVGHPRHWGLWAGGLLCRDDSRCVTELMECWWAEIQRWSWRDQISLPFALRSRNFVPDEWPWPLFQNPYMKGWTWNRFDSPVVEP